MFDFAKKVCDCYKNGVPLSEIREKIMNQIPGCFGIHLSKISEIKDDFPKCEPGFDAPNNIAITVAGLIYGKGDFGKSISIAVNCGEDTDCSAATVGATLGILKGANELPEKWIKPLGNRITTCCINLTLTAGGKNAIPQTINELTERCLRLIPTFLDKDACYFNSDSPGFTVVAEKKLDLEKYPVYIPYSTCNPLPYKLPFEKLINLQPYVDKYNFDLFTVLVDYMGEPYIKKDIPREIKITVFDNGITKHQDFLSATVYTSEGIELLSGKRFNAPLQNTYGYNVCHTLRFTAVDFPTEYCELLINFRLLGRHTNETVRIALFPGVE